MIWPADGQNPAFANRPAYKMVITNALHVPDAWVVFELQMFFGHCYQNNRVPAWGGNYFASGNRRENPESTMAQAFDNILSTNWTADCKISMVGCRPYQQYLGLDITGTAPWENAMGSNASAEDREACEVKCIKLYQSDHPMHKADAVAIQGVYLGGSPFEFRTIMVFNNVAGGAWSRRPAEKNTLWRMTNIQPTMVRWGVAELRFYQDIFCTDEVRGAALSSGAHQKLFFWEGRAFDGDEETAWLAECESMHWTNGVKHGPLHCGMREAWIGVDFGDSQLTIRCMKFHQMSHDLETPVPELPKFSDGVALERYDGKKWVEVERFWNENTDYTVPSSLWPTLATKFVGTLGVKPGNWEDTRPADRAAWRILNDDWVAGEWHVHEFELYTDDNCGGTRLTGEAMSMAGTAGLEDAKFAFDGLSGFDNVWRSTCVGVQGSCNPHEAWVGLYFRDSQPNVTCFRFLQTQTQAHQASSIAVGVWLDGKWSIDSIHRDVGGGTWNRRPSQPWSMWRVLNNEVVPRQWKVVELRAYNDSLCLRELGAADPLLRNPIPLQNPIGSGYLTWRDQLDHGFDGTALTSWGADCVGCADRKYWIGGELQNSSRFQEALNALEDANLGGESIVKCIRIWQSPDFLEQSPSLRVDVWNGKDWQVSVLSSTGVVGGGGGGVWMRSPSNFATRWRMVAADGVNRNWRVHEVEFYRDTNCTDRLRLPSDGGTSVVMSGYDPEIVGYRLEEIGGSDLFSEGEFPFDGVSETSVKLISQPSASKPAWYGIDFLDESTWVRCVRIKQGSLTPEQSPTLELEYWDGNFNWSQADPEMAEREKLLTELGGGGWQRRPAADKSIWRLENKVHVPEGWAIYEAELHESTLCKDPVTGSNSSLTGEPVASGFTPQEKYYGPHLAFDGDLSTPWVSQCAETQANLLPPGFEAPPVGCAPGDAWIGLDLHLQPRDIHCVRLYQVGYRNMQSSSVGVTKWNGNQWEHVWTMDGLGGSAWDQRPAGPNTLWRLFHKVTRPAKCRREKNRIFRRTWGVSEFKLYADDDCEKPLTDGTPIGSGTVEIFRETPYDPPDYRLSRAFDGDGETEWAANCLLGWRKMNQSRTHCEGEWLGLDFGDRAVEVRCLKIMQSRRETSTCCDPASEMVLHRWNGLAWVEASWRHEPSPGSQHSPRNLGATFIKMGKCQEDSYEGDIPDLRIWEQRGRRESDKCLVPLTGATVLLGDPACVEHRQCQEAFGVEGQCCPLEGTFSRCCCNYLMLEPIFVDEVESDGVKEYMQFEQAMIVISDYIPWIGGGIFCLLFFLAVCMPAYSKERMLAWSRVVPEGRCACCKCCPFCRKLLLVIVYPALAWRTFLREEAGDGAWFLYTHANFFCRWFCLPGGRIHRGLEWFRGLLWIAIGVYFGGVLPWLSLGAMFGQAALFLLLCLGLSIRWSKSPYDPTNPQDMVLRTKVTGLPLKDEFHTAQAVDVGRDFISCVVLGIIYFLKFIFDLLVCRAQLISYEAIPSIEADRVVDIFPGLVKLLREPGMVIYDIMYWASQFMTYVIGYFVGIPRCEGSCVLIGSVALVMVLVTLTKFLNYDFFGLYTAARQVAKSTRPECQKAFVQGLVMMCLSITFGAIQCAMVLFSRAIKVASPFRETEWACEWDDLMALMVGRGLILVATIVGTTFFFLCANGHFMGQDYIIKPVGRFLKLNLDELDPDGTGPEGGLFQCEVMLAALPTLAGVWIDWWNVKAFLVEARATIYSQQLRDPQPCLHCGRIHCRYVNVMCATGRTISLACQILPYGIIIGKMSEYANDPPLIYWGKELTCVTVAPTPVEPRPDLGKNKFGLKLLLFVADAATFSSEFILPVVRRLCVLMMYIFMMIGIFAITEENLLDMGKKVILAGFYLAFIKAAGEGLLETSLSWTVGLVYMSIARLQGTLRGVDLARTVGGQALSGSCVASVASVCIIRLEWMSQASAIAFAGLIGYAVSVLALILNLALETVPPKADEPPRRNPFPILAKAGFSFAVAGLCGLFTAQVLLIRSIMAVSAMVLALQLITMSLVLVEHKTVLSEREDGRDLPKHGAIREGDDAPAIVLSSATWIALTTRNFLPALVGIFAASAAGTSFSQAVAYFIDSSQGAVSALVAGIPSGLVTALSVLSVVNKSPIVIGLFAGGGTFVGVSFWNGLVGIFFGAIVGVSVGSLLEIFEVNRVKKEHKDWVKIDNKRRALEESPEYLEEQERNRRASTMARTAKFEEAITKAANRKVIQDEVKLMLEEEEAHKQLPDDAGSPVAQGMLQNDAAVRHGSPVAQRPIFAVTDAEKPQKDSSALLALPPAAAGSEAEAGESRAAGEGEAAELRGAAQGTDAAEAPALDAPASQAAETHPPEKSLGDTAGPSAGVSADGAAHAAKDGAPLAASVVATTTKAPSSSRAAAGEREHPRHASPQSGRGKERRARSSGAPAAQPASPAPPKGVIADGFSLERDNEPLDEPPPAQPLAHPALMNTASQTRSSSQAGGQRRTSPRAPGQRSARRGQTPGSSARGAAPAGQAAPEEDAGARDGELFGRWESRGSPSPTRATSRSNAQRPPASSNVQRNTSNNPQRKPVVAQSLWGKAPPPERHRIERPTKPVRLD